MKIEVRSSAVSTKSGTGKNGKPYNIREQECRVEMNDEVRKVRLTLADDAQPYAPGVYALADSSFIVNQYGGLEIGRAALVPVKG